ncbi:MAG: response regulator [Saprospiraceae bacterium]
MKKDMTSARGVEVLHDDRRQYATDLRTDFAMPPVSSVTNTFVGKGVALSPVQRSPFIGNNYQEATNRARPVNIEPRETPLTHTPPLSERVTGMQNTGVRVLIAEDNALVRISLANLFERWGIDTTICEDGQQAWDVLQKESFDLVFLDLQMPRINGHEVVMLLRNQLNQPNQFVPVVAIAAADDTLVAQSMYEAGVNEYLAKPFQPQDIFQLVKRYTLLSDAQLSRMYVDKLDTMLLHELYDGNEEHIRMMFNLYLDSTRSIMDALEIALQDEDMEDVERQLHKVKPSFAMVGLPALTTMASELEDEVKLYGKGKVFLRRISPFILAVRRSFGVIESRKEHIPEILKR